MNNIIRRSLSDDGEGEGEGEGDFVTGDLVTGDSVSMASEDLHDIVNETFEEILMMANEEQERRR